MGKEAVSGVAQWAGKSFHRFPWERRDAQVDALISKQQLSSAGFCGSPETLVVVWQKPRFSGSKGKLTFRWDRGLKEELNHHGGYRHTLSESERPFGQEKLTTLQNQSGNPWAGLVYGSFCFSPHGNQSLLICDWSKEPGLQHKHKKALTYSFFT